MLIFIVSFRSESHTHTHTRHMRRQFCLSSLKVVQKKNSDPYLQIKFKSQVLKSNAKFGMISTFKIWRLPRGASYVWNQIGLLIPSLATLSQLAETQDSLVHGRVVADLTGLIFQSVTWKQQICSLKTLKKQVKEKDTWVASHLMWCGFPMGPFPLKLCLTSSPPFKIL